MLNSDKELYKLFIQQWFGSIVMYFQRIYLESDYRSGREIVGFIELVSGYFFSGTRGRSEIMIDDGIPVGWKTPVNCVKHH